MTVLIIAEHDNQHLAAATRHAVTAGSKLGEVHVLVAGSGAAAVAEQAKQVAGVAKVLLADAEHYAGGLAEELAPLVVKLAADYRYVAAAASTFGKNLMPRVAALLDCPQVSDLTEIVDGKTFVRPIYAGNAFATVSSDADKLALTFRITAFAEAAARSGDAGRGRSGSGLEPFHQPRAGEIRPPRADAGQSGGFRRPGFGQRGKVQRIAATVGRQTWRGHWCFTRGGGRRLCAQ